MKNKRARIKICLLALLAFTQVCTPALCQRIYPSPYTFTTVAEKSSIHFNPKSVAVDAEGQVYFADSKKHVICRVEPSGAITIIAGKSGSSGSSDGTGDKARFHYPRGIAADATGNIYVADTGNNTIRKITPDGTVTTLAGLAGTVGSRDGTGSDARFNYPAGVAVDVLGNVYVADLYNSTIRKVNSNGIVTTIAGQAGLFGGADGPGAIALFNFPVSIAVDSHENAYVADYMNNAVRKITVNGMVTTLAGKMSYSGGDTDGRGDAASFFRPSGIALDRSGNIFVCDSGNNTIRRITPGGAVTTLAGLPGQPGFADGNGTEARFWRPTTVALDRLGNLYVTDLINAAIRKGAAATSTATNDALSLKTSNRPGALTVNSTLNDETIRNQFSPCAAQPASHLGDCHAAIAMTLRSFKRWSTDQHL